ncbi:aminopeptidase N [Nocardioides sp.]|uniref:aminopeptidase N n=1 Tax=Nocardioides sp. TaxID=35761 RepID=UPI0039E5D7E0
MPGTNLTRAEAAERAGLLDVATYAVELDLTTGERTFASTTTVTFTANTPGASTFVDLVDADLQEITLNGVALDPASAYADSRIALSDLAAENTLVVRADLPYSHSGEGLHRFVDPVDGKVYTYSQFEVPDARRVFATFEQPDLKASFQFTVTAPEHWVVVSNSPTPEPEQLGDGRATWRFEPTKPMSTYVAAIVAGEYVGVHDVYEGKFGTIPLGHYTRASLAPYLDREEVVKLTKQGFAFFEEAFDYPYPFGKYDQLYVPEYNMGAMENAGAVTLRDEYIPRSRQPRSFYEFRASVILHEMAHMWFGDLVTMKWWDDLWLNESFAEWACYWAEAEATEFKDAWTGFTNARKLTGYRQDTMVTTHPIAPVIDDLHDTEVNFDMITYAKGASVLKQLVAWVGQEPFLAGLRSYFKEFEFGNAVFDDLLRHLEAASGRELASWAQEWLQTSEVNTLSPEFTLDAEGRYAGIAVRQRAHPDHPVLRRHRLGIGLYDKAGSGSGAPGALTRRRYVEIDVEGELTEVPELVGEAQPDLLLLNDEDLAYAKIRLDERSLATALTSLSAIPDSLPRALIWSAAWDMTRDAEMPAHDFIELVLANIGAETDSWGISRMPLLAELVVNGYAAPERRLELKQRWEAGLRELLLAAEPGSDAQLSFVRRYCGAGEILRGGISGTPVGEQTIADLTALLDGSWTVPGLDVDQDLRWYVVIGLCAAGVFGEAQVAAELERDQTITGQEKAWEARAAIPTAPAKAAAWEKAWEDASTPNETHRSIIVSFARAGQEELIAPYLPRMLAAADTLLDRIGAHKGAVAYEYGFPRMLTSPEQIRLVEDWIATSTAPVGPMKFIREGLDEMKRGRAAQAKDAESAEVRA